MGHGLFPLKERATRSRKEKICVYMVSKKTSLSFAPKRKEGGRRSPVSRRKGGKTTVHEFVENGTEVERAGQGV